MKKIAYGIVIIAILMHTNAPAELEIGNIHGSITGVASWYAEFSPGINEYTANGEVFDHDGMTCAMWGVPFGTVLKVTNLKTLQAVYVRVNDRGPAERLVKQGRIIDLTKGAFEKIGYLQQGLIRVKIEIAATKEAGEKSS